MRFSAHGLISSLNFFSKIHFLILSLPILLLHIIIITVADCVCCEGGHIQTHIVHRRKKWHFPGENEKTLIIFEGRKKKTRCQDVHLSTSARMCACRFHRRVYFKSAKKSRQVHGMQYIFVS